VDDDATGLDRRALLSAVATAGVGTMAGCSFLESEDDAPVTAVDDDRARELAVEFAPTMYFDENEQWFPTDPRPYESERDGETIVDGFDALEGYTAAFDGDEPPAATAFYHVVEYEDSPLSVVQYWLYSAFDQFSTNFHWHDWELLQAFVDTDTGEPQLYVASSHSRSVPNNEFLDPDPDRQPRILSELGSHSSGLSVNEEAERFQRFPTGGDVADITNSVVEGIEDIAAIPLAYGLPRDEGLALPFVVPELDGAPVYEHERLPSVEASDLIPAELTIRSFDDLRSPPSDLPQRATGLRFEHSDRDQPAADATYDLVPASELEHIEEFAGPQLSFEFTIPQFAEDAIAGHITTTGVPWKGERYTNPASDISEARHRAALSDRYDAIGAPSEFDQVLVGVTNAVTSEDAPENEGLTTVESPLELFALLQSEPEAVPTFRGLAVVQDVPEGEHTLTINGAGVAPHSETVAVPGDGSVTVAGASGEIPMVARENATKLEVDPRNTETDLNRLAVEDDFAGRLYDAPLSGPDAVYVHRGGAFTTEVRDSDDVPGAFRVNPGQADERVRIDDPETGKTPLATFLVDIAEETQAEVAALVEDSDTDDSDDDPPGNSGGTGSGTDTGGASGGQAGPVRGLSQALEAVVESARRAAERAEAGDRGNADQQLRAVADRLERVSQRLAEASDAIPQEVANAVERRLEQARRRAQQAQESEKL
jgi:hypothetical protein